MDPNALLQWLRELSDDVNAGDGKAAAELAGCFQDLDRWLCKGGLAPAEWRAALAPLTAGDRPGEGGGRKRWRT
jgi:hypothetical protein